MHSNIYKYCSISTHKYMRLLKIDKCRRIRKDIEKSTILIPMAMWIVVTKEKKIRKIITAYKRRKRKGSLGVINNVGIYIQQLQTFEVRLT